MFVFTKRTGQALFIKEACLYSELPAETAGTLNALPAHQHMSCFLELLCYPISNAAALPLIAGLDSDRDFGNATSAFWLKTEARSSKFCSTPQAQGALTAGDRGISLQFAAKR